MPWFYRGGLETLVKPSGSGDCICVCVCVFSSHLFMDVKFVGCISRGHTGGRSHKIFHPPSFCVVCLYFSREKDSAVSFPRRP